jgi:hypothetical protein
MAANAAIKRAASKGSTQVILNDMPPSATSAKPKAAAKAPARKPAAHAAVKAAAKRYTGPLADSLNELSDAEQRAHDVAARRQDDAKAYASFVMGQQGAIQGAAVAADQRALQQTVGLQAAGAASNAQGLGALERARAAQGIAGPVPSQQLAGVIDAQTRGNDLSAASSQNLADTANSNQGKAGFLKAAAQAALMANQRGIAGDEFNQTSAIRREKVGVLSQRDQMAAQASSDAAKIAADQAIAEARLNSDAQDRASRENIADAGLQTRSDIAAAGRAEQEKQGRANRRVRLKTSSIGAAALGYVAPAEQKRRNTAVSKLNTTRDAAVADAKQIVTAGGLTDPNDVRAYLNKHYKGAPKEAIDYAIAAALRRRSGMKGSAAKRYYTLLNKVKRGEIG